MEKEQKEKRKPNKIRILLLIIIFALIFSIITMIIERYQNRQITNNAKKQEVSKEEAKIKPNSSQILLGDFYKTVYVPGMYVSPFEGNILLYDKKSLTLLDAKNLENSENPIIFATNISIGNFILKTRNKNIYLADMDNLIIYKFDNEGIATGQGAITKKPLDIYPLDNDKLLVSYDTGSGTTGIMLLDQNLKTIEDITYPEGFITIIGENETTGDIVTSVIAESGGKILNKFFSYDKNLKLLAAKEIENMAASSIKSSASTFIAIDPDMAVITKDGFETQNSVPAGDFFSFFEVTTGSIYILDGENKVKQYDLNLEPVDEKNYENPLILIKKINGDIAELSKYEIFYKDRSIKTQNELIDIFDMGNSKALLIFKGGLKIVEI